MARGKSEKKLYYKIGEVCKELDIQPYVLRYWETEFPSLSPNKSRSGQRVYSAKEIVLIRRIKQLLYDEGYTIAGAKKKLDAEQAAGTLTEAVAAGDGGEQLALEPAVQEKLVQQKVEAVEKEAEERLQALRQGVEQALGETRDLLDFLDSKAS